jgi:tetratricopeptide (TPR) repeat protein
MHGRNSDSLAAILVGCALLCLAGAANGWQQETAEQFVERVKKAIQNDEWGRARSGIKHALALKPDSPEANFIAAQVYWQEGARSMAIAALEKAVANQPDYPAAHLLLARCLANDNKPDRAREEVTIAIAQGTPLFSAYRLRGELDIAKDDLEAAVNSFETAAHFAAGGDDADAAQLRTQIESLRDFSQRVKGVAHFEALQKQLNIVGPILLNNIGAGYTEQARVAKIQGSVFMIALISEKGDVESVVPFRRLGNGLDESAIAACLRLKFTPATKDGTPIPYWKKIEFGFFLR